MTKYLLRASGLTWFCLATFGTSFAATDGTLGATSTGTSDVVISLSAATAPDIQISGLKDISDNLDTDAGVVRLGDVAACVYATKATNFTLELSAPHLIGKATGLILPYDVIVSYGMNGNNVLEEKPYPSGSADHTFSGLPADTTPGCSGSALGYAVTFDTKAASTPTQTDDYQGMLTFIVTPE